MWIWAIESRQIDNDFLKYVWSVEFSRESPNEMVMILSNRGTLFRQNNSTMQNYKLLETR